MKRLWFILVLEATCRAVPSIVGSTTVFPELMLQNTRCAEAFVMPTGGTIQTISIYHEAGSGHMLLGVYLGDTTPDVCVGVTASTLVSASVGWQTVALTNPVWVSAGTVLWLAWVFELNPGIRYQAVAAGWVESGGSWDGGMPSSFGSDWQSDRLYSIYATYTSTAHPIINEVLPRNDTLSGAGFQDEDGTKQGWIELYNPFDLSIDLTGYYLSDDPNALQKWAFPTTSIGSHQFLRVWTSGKNRTTPGRPLHTSFNLMDTGSVFLTYGTAANKIDMLEGVKIPVNYSYGRYPDGGGDWYFYTQPTPGLPNTSQNRRQFVIDQRLVSLTVGSPLQLTVTPPQTRVVWDSDNPLVEIDPAKGLLVANQDAWGQNARAIITARSVDGNCVDSCQVTIVNWTANLSDLEVTATPFAPYILATEANAVFYVISRGLYSTSDGFQTSQFLSTLPEDHLIMPKMLVTPFGYFVQCANTISRSYDLVHWTVSYTMNMSGLYHDLDYYWDPASRTGYVYAGEYSCVDTDHHRVCRGVFPADGSATWKTVLDFNSPAEWAANSSPFTLPAVWAVGSLVPLAARHIHAVSVDPYTGHVWVTTGDTYEHAQLFYSDNDGETFRLVAAGSQKYRCISIWFTEGYVYWAMDTWDPPSCWRISRSRFNVAGYWPCMTPELASGTTKVGGSYIVTASNTPSRFPVAVGRIYTETVARTLDQTNRVRAVEDSQYDYKEKVADLSNGSLWYHLWVHDEQGDPILILAQAAEGEHRDLRGRVFGIKELANGKVDVQELLSVVSTNPNVYDAYVQLEPRTQDSRGNIYFTGRDTGQWAYKTRLTWVDNPLR